VIGTAVTGCHAVRDHPAGEPTSHIGDIYKLHLERSFRGGKPGLVGVFDADFGGRFTSFSIFFKMAIFRVLSRIRAGCVLSFMVALEQSAAAGESNPQISA
jgi:hypothetical protein